LILTPGVGAQGGKPGEAVAHGADFEIVGRAIYQSSDPKRSVERVRREINKRGSNSRKI
jgi:orotidine-5'-phosphate decarboxylase